MTTKRAYFQSRRRAAAGFAAMLVGAVAIITGSGGGASAAHVDPVFHAKNQSCGQLGYLHEFKINGVPANSPPPYAINVDGTPGTITIANSDGFTFDFASTITVSAVFVKAADGGNLYAYDPPTAGDTGLVSPLTKPDDPNSPQARVSHVSFCFDEVDDTTTTTVDDTTTTVDETTTTVLVTTTTAAPTTTTAAPTTTESVLGTTATTEEETTTTEAATTTEETEETVQGVVVGRQLPRTGSGSTLPMTEAGLVLVGIGFAFLASSRLTEQRI